MLLSADDGMSEIEKVMAKSEANGRCGAGRFLHRACSARDSCSVCSACDRCSISHQRLLREDDYLTARMFSPLSCTAHVHWHDFRVISEAHWLTQVRQTEGGRTQLCDRAIE